MAGRKQAAVTVAFGPNGERLDSTFVSFAQNPLLELHAFIIGERLPEKRLPQITYHLRPADPAFSYPLRDAVYRRWLFIDDLEVEYAVVVDNRDVLNLQPMPELPVLLRGAALGACVEHEGGRYIPGQPQLDGDFQTVKMEGQLFIKYDRRLWTQELFYECFKKLRTDAPIPSNYYPSWYDKVRALFNEQGFIFRDFQQKRYRAHKVV